MFALAFAAVDGVHAGTATLQGVLSVVTDYASRERASLHAPSDIVVIFNASGQTLIRSQTVSGWPLTADAPVRLASFTKSYTAYVVEQLAHDGTLSLDAPIGQYLPWFRTACAARDRKITVRALLDQRSGIPTAFGMNTLFANDRTDAHAIDDGVRGTASACFANAATASFEYANPNYNILGSLIQAVTGNSYESEIDRRIAAPLHLPLKFSWQLKDNEQLAEQSTLIAGRPYRNYVHRADRMNAPSAGIVASAQTQARWLSTLLGPNGEIIRRDIAGDPNSYAMGWFREQAGSVSYLWAPSWGPGSLGVAVLIPQKRIGAVFIVNAAGFGQFFREPTIAQGLAKSLLGEPSVRAPGQILVEYAERLLLPLLITVQLCLSTVMFRRASRRMHAITASVNALIAAAIMWFFPAYGGSFATGFLFAPVLTLELLTIAAVAAIFSAGSVSKLYRKRSAAD